MELVARTYRSRIVNFVPDFAWNFIPNAPIKNDEIWSKVFTNTPNP